jgi:hypothetical protein
MELGRDSRRGNCMGQIVKYWYQIVCCDVKDLVKQCYKWQKRNWSGRSWNVELKEALYNIGLAFVWTKQQECILREIINIIKGRCNDTEQWCTEGVGGFKPP